jgi:hypothetical protein
MQEPSADNILALKKFLEDQDFLVEETKSGMRIRLNSEHIIEVNALIRDSDFFWASFETPKLPPDQLKAILNDIRNTLSKGLTGMARLGQFEETQDGDDRLVFVADIELLPSVIYQGIVQMKDLLEAPVHIEKVHAPSDESHSKVQSDLPGQPLEIMTAEKAVLLLETVDGKMLRQSLDMMNLRRSSNIRLALTRIFRSAMDSEALMSAMQEEAGKLTSSEDLRELEMIRIISATGFLQPVVELLCQEVFQKK